MTQINMDKAVAAYVAVRDKIRAEEEKHKQDMKPLKELLTQYEGLIMQELSSANVSSMKTEHGTAIRSTRKSATVADGAVFREFIQKSGMWEVADLRANAPAVAAFIDEHKETPPGVNFTTVVTLSVRK